MSCTVSLKASSASSEIVTLLWLQACLLHGISFPSAPLYDMELSSGTKERSTNTLIALLASIPTLPRKRLGSKIKNARWTHSKSKPVALNGLDSVGKYSASTNESLSQRSLCQVEFAQNAQGNGGVASMDISHKETVDALAPTQDLNLGTNGDTGLSAITMRPESKDVISGDISKDTPEPHIKLLAEGWYVDLGQALPENLQRTWSSKLHQRLRNILIHEMGESHFSLECHMLGSGHGHRPEPTVLIMCMSSVDKVKIDDTFRRRSCVPADFRYKVLVLDIELCSFRDPHDSGFPPELMGSEVKALCYQIEDRTIVFANMSKISPQAQDKYVTSTFTLGGVISIDQELYGLSIGHCVEAEGRDERHATTLSGMIQQYSILH